MNILSLDTFCELFSSILLVSHSFNPALKSKTSFSILLFDMDKIPRDHLSHKLGPLEENLHSLPIQDKKEN